MVRKVLLILTQIGSRGALLAQGHHPSLPHIRWVTSVVYRPMVVVNLQMSGARIPLVFSLTETTWRMTTLTCVGAAGREETLAVCR